MFQEKGVLTQGRVLAMLDCGDLSIYASSSVLVLASQ